MDRRDVQVFDFPFGWKRAERLLCFRGLPVLPLTSCHPWQQFSCNVSKIESSGASLPPQCSRWGAIQQFSVTSLILMYHLCHWISCMYLVELVSHVKSQEGRGTAVYFSNRQAAFVPLQWRRPSETRRKHPHKVTSIWENQSRCWLWLRLRLEVFG